MDYILDLMRQQSVSMDQSIFNELILRHARREELEMCIQQLDDMFTWQLGPMLESVEAVVALASQKANARLAYELAYSYEANSTRRLSAKAWMNVLISSAQSLFVSHIL